MAETEKGAVSSNDGNGADAAENRPERILSGGPRGQRLFREGEEFLLQSDLLTVRLNRAGQVLSLRPEGPDEAWEAAGRADEYLPAVPERESYYDAWEIGSMYEQEEEALDTADWHMTEDVFEGRPAWRLEGRIKESPLTQYICLSPDGRMAEFHTRIDWQERHRIAEGGFPGGLPFGPCDGRGCLRRLDQTDHPLLSVGKGPLRGLRTPLQRAGGRQIRMALINDCKYGFSAKEDRISLTLLRSPLMPDMHADQGRQEFSYACFPYAGAFRNAQVLERAAEFNRRSHVDAALRERQETADGGSWNLCPSAGRRRAGNGLPRIPGGGEACGGRKRTGGAQAVRIGRLPSAGETPSAGRAAEGLRMGKHSPGGQPGGSFA